MLYSLDEICLTPAAESMIEHRSDVIIHNTHNKLPLFTAPMHCVVDFESAKKFEEVGINTIIPRTIPWDDRYEAIKDGKWVAVGFKEAEHLYEVWRGLDVLGELPERIRICIDQADGHLNSLLKLCEKLKDLLGKHIKIMTGNIANPFTYKRYAEAGVDYIRCGIGGGSACTTSVQTGMHYPMGSLIINCNKERKKVKEMIAFGAKFKSVPKIIADGGFKRIDQIVKALALGADYVMLGEVFAMSEEACGQKYYKSDDGRFSELENEDLLYANAREYFGMSTVKAQILVNDASRFKIDNFKPKHSEGAWRLVPIEYSIKEWIEDFEHALRSSMSYAGTRTLYGDLGYVGNVDYEYMTPVTYNAYMK